MAFIVGAKAAGVAPKSIKYVPSSTGNGMAQLLGGQVQVYSTDPSTAEQQVRAGKVRVLAITSAQRVKGSKTIESFPTLKEQGYDVNFVNWRCFMGTPDMPPDAKSYYADAFKKMIGTDEWKKTKLKYGWSDLYKTGDEFNSYLAGKQKQYTELLKEIGIKVKG